MWQRIKQFLFQNKTAKQTIVKNTFWLSISNVGGRVIRAGIILYAARVLGAAGYGVFSYAINYAAFFTIFIDFGINSILIKESSKSADAEYQSKILSTSLFIKLFLLAIGVLILNFVAPKFTAIEGVNAIIPIVSAVFVFDALREFGFSILRARERMEIETGLFSFTNVAIVVFGVIFLKTFHSVSSFAYSYAIGTGIGAFTTFFVLRKDLRGALFNFSKKFVSFIIKASWPFAISGALGMLMISTDILMIGWYRSAADVGLYSAANRIIQILYIAPSIIALSALPAFARLAKEKERMRSALEKVISITFLAAIPIVVGGVLLGSQIIGTLFGNDFVSATSSFQILLLTILIDFPAVLLSNAVFSYDKQKDLIIYSALGGVFNVIFDLIFIPRFGIIGSAWATLLAQFISNAYLWIITRRLVSFHILPHLPKIIGASAIMALAIYAMQALHANVFAVIATGGAVYFIALYVFKEKLLREIKSTFARGGESTEVPAAL